MKLMMICMATALWLMICTSANAAVEDGTGTGITKASACSAAKSAASNMCRTLHGASVKRYEACDCEEINYTYDKWSCSVDAECEAKKTSSLLLPSGQTESSRTAGEVCGS